MEHVWRVGNRVKMSRETNLSKSTVAGWSSWVTDFTDAPADVQQHLAGADLFTAERMAVGCYEICDDGLYLLIDGDNDPYDVFGSLVDGRANLRSPSRIRHVFARCPL